MKRKIIRHKVKQVLKKHGLNPNGSNKDLATKLAGVFGYEPPADGHKNSCYPIYLKALNESGLDVPRVTLTRKQEKQRDITAFYKSYEWRKVRLQILKRDGRRCACCGATPEDQGVCINVDHIKPVRRFWDLRLDPDNLQVLCGACNHGKGNWDMTDFRADDR